MRTSRAESHLEKCFHLKCVWVSCLYRHVEKKMSFHWLLECDDTVGHLLTSLFVACCLVCSCIWWNDLSLSYQPQTTLQTTLWRKGGFHANFNWIIQLLKLSTNQSLQIYMLCLPSDVRVSWCSLYLSAFAPQTIIHYREQTTTPGTPCPTLCE